MVLASWFRFCLVKFVNALTSMDLLKSYKIEECSSQELVEMLSKESLLGSDDCAVMNFSIRLSNPSGASETNPAMCKVFCKP